MLLFDLISGDLQDLSVLHAAWACGFARSTAEALVQVSFDVFLPTKLALQRASH
jgi:hypothetical protein